MAPKTRPGGETKARAPAADSVARDPTEEPTPDQHDLPPVDAEDAPKGQPTSDRFQSEQAHRTRDEDSKTP